MAKKYTAIIIALLVVIISTLNVFAGNPDGSNSKTGNDKTSFSDTKSYKAAGGNNTTGSAITAGEFEAVLEEVLQNVSEDSGPEIVTLTSPEVGLNSTYDSILFISGKTDYDDVVVCIVKYDKESDSYVPMLNTDGESSWEVGSFRLFSKKIKLHEGTNLFKVAFYRTSQMKKATRNDIQIKCYSIDLLKESIIDKIINTAKDLGKGFVSITDLIKGK